MLVEFQGKGFWAYDVVAAVLLKHMIDAAQTIAHLPVTSWLQDVIAQWQFNAVFSDCGFFLDDAWSNVQLQRIQDLIKMANTQLATRDFIPADEIQSWQFGDDEQICLRGHDLIPTANVIRLGQGVAALLQNQMEDPPTGTWWFYGLGETKETIQMAS